MGTQLETHVVGLVCEVRDCPMRIPWNRLFGYQSSWHALVGEIREAVTEGWAFSLSGRLLSYCPEHADLVRQCRCGKGRPNRCALHDSSMASQVWDAVHVPIDVSIMTGVRS